MRRKKLSPCNVYLPMELVTEVLARLPVKSLLRFRCVCKSWNSLISSPDFASLHLAHYHNDSVDNEFILMSHVLSQRWMLRSARTFRKTTSRFCKRLRDNDFKCCNGYRPWGSSVNGLLLLYYKEYHSLGPRPVNIILWNPIIGKIHKLPTLSIGRLFAFGLGFHLSINDYKVVAIASRSIHIYTVSSRTWRSTVNDRHNFDVDVHSPGLLIEGALFWVAKDYEKNSSLMLSFDVKDEVLDYITVPPIDLLVYRRHPVAYRKRVGLLDIDNLTCNLWVMEKDQAPGTWSKLYTVDLQVLNLQEDRVPDIVCFQNNGQFIIAIEKKGIYLCHIMTPNMKHLMRSYAFYPMMSSPSYSTLFKESLVMI